jgi:hypothetical protein
MPAPRLDSAPTDAAPGARVSAHSKSHAKRTMGKSGTTAQRLRRAGFGVGLRAAERVSFGAFCKNAPLNSRDARSESWGGLMVTRAGSNALGTILNRRKSSSCPLYGARRNIRGGSCHSGATNSRNSASEKLAHVPRRSSAAASGHVRAGQSAGNPPVVTSALCPINSAARWISSPPCRGARAVRAPIGAGGFAGDGARA